MRPSRLTTLYLAALRALDAGENDVKPLLDFARSYDVRWNFGLPLISCKLCDFLYTCPASAGVDR